MALPDEKVIAALNAADWDDIAPRLLKFIRCLMTTKGIKQLPKGMTVEDLADIIVEEIYSGQRDWNPDKHKNLLVHLQWIAKSKLSNKGLLGLKKEAVQYTDSEKELNSINIVKDPPPSSEDESSFIQALYEEVAGDKDLQNIVVAIELGYSKSGDIARETKLSTERVYELRRKLYSRAQKARENLQKCDKTEGDQ